ncbi:hypothetical protein [Limnohabitans sp.]|uniref:hypothetical protein n=1 Tax=Limnohabitans sp. TaxID=1907725 RepID=UPI0033412455
MRALIRAWSATAESKAMLDEVRSKDKKRWYALVRQCRIKNNAEEIGLANMRTRKQAVLTSTQSMLQAVGVADTSDILWLTQPRYVAHQIYVEGIAGRTFEEKEQAALAKWARDYGNPDIVRRGTGTDTQLGVLGVPRTQGYRRRESARQVKCVDSVHGATEMANALNLLADHGTTAQALTGRAMGDFGLAFLQGAASSSSDTQPASLPARVASTPPINAVCDPSLLEPATGYSGTPETFGDKRTLATGPSSTSKRAKGGATGALLDMRTDALAAIKKACQAHGTARTNMAARWEALCTAGHGNMAGAPPDMAAWLNTFKDTLAYLKADAKKDVGAWTLSTAGPRSQDLTQYIVRLEQASTCIGAQVQAAEELAKRRRKEATSDMRRAQCERTRLLAPWRSAHVPVEARVPMPFLRFMLEHGMLVKGHGLLQKGHGKVAVHDGDGAPLIDTRPWVLCFNAAGPGSDMARLRSAIGDKRIDDAVTKADAFLNQDGTRLSCDTRLPPHGGGHDSLEELAWVPKQWRDTSHTPEALRSLGTPWLLSHDVAATRVCPEQWPMSGFGHFLSVQRGDMLACVLPASPLLERGCTMHNCVSFLAQLQWHDFHTFLVTHCLFADLVPGRALWVPYGWRCILLTRTPNDESHVLHVPYVCARMVQEAAKKDDIVAFAKQAVVEWANTMSNEACLTLAKEAKTWLEKVATPEIKRAQSPTVEQMAIEDGYS